MTGREGGGRPEDERVFVACREAYERLREQIARVIVGQEEVVEWYTAPFSHGLPYVGRFGDEVVVQTPMLADNEGHFSMTVDGGNRPLPRA